MGHSALGAAGRLAAALLVGLGVAIAGWFVGSGFVESRLGVRSVTVKGLAERDVRADLAIWPLRFVATGNELGTVREKIAADEAVVRKFVADGGLRDATAEVAGFEVTDALAQIYRSGPVESRFVMAQTVVVRSPDVDGVAALAQRVGELVSAGVVLSSEGGAAGGPVYLFTALNAAKPEMVAEATGNARASAEQFAADSGSRLGGIRSASQGVFQILARDEAPGLMEPYQIAKRLRVVSTVEYFLAD
jgi:uncharacterized protein